MGYRSNVFLKTNKTGYIMLKELNDNIKEEENRPLKYATIEKTKSDFYKISFYSFKWYEGEYEEVDNFMKMILELDEQDIPYSYIRLGEDITDIEHKCNWTDDMPEEIYSFEPVPTVYDNDKYKVVQK